jgi:predicted RNA-binding protein YlxR (DUF448 family)
MTATSHTLLADKKSPSRKCVVTGESYDKSELLCFVRAPDSTLVFDINGKLPGRSAYLRADAETLMTAIKKNLFAKSFKDKTVVPPDLPTQIITQLFAAALQSLALARRAGDAVAGTEKSQDFARQYADYLVILASDAGNDGQQNARKIAQGRDIIAEFDRETLGKIFGREQAVVMVMRGGGIKKRFLSIIHRLRAVKGLEKPAEIA